MDSMERTLAVLNGNIPDRIPLFFLLATYGAKFKRISIKNYFGKRNRAALANLPAARVKPL